MNAMADLRKKQSMMEIEMENYIHDTIIFIIDLLTDNLPKPILSWASNSTEDNSEVKFGYHLCPQQQQQHQTNCLRENGRFGENSRYESRKINEFYNKDIITNKGIHIKHLTQELCNRGWTKPLKKLACGDSVQDRVLIFVWQHPTIFCVVDDYVSLQRMSPDLDSIVEQSLESRALEYLTFRCKSYGECKILISKLFGNLKQASADVQFYFHDYVNFSNFLQKHDRIFILLENKFIALREVFERYAYARRELPRCDEYLLDPQVLDCSSYINTLPAAQSLVNFVLQHRPVIAVDCEGVNLGAPRGFITLVQLGFVDVDSPYYPYPFERPHLLPDLRPYIRIFLVDVQENPEIMTRCLKHIFESPNHLKIFQGCATDSRALFQNYNIRLKCVFDTVISHQLLRQDDIKSDLYYLYETYVKDSTSRLKKDIKKLYIRTPTLWATRPLTNILIYYAAFDVYALLRIHNAMLIEIQKDGYPNVIEKFNDVVMRSNKVASMSHESRHFYASPSQCSLLSGRQYRR